MKDRVRWVDWSRAIAIIGVLLGHAPLNGSIVEKWLDIWIYSFHIPLFFFISGYLHSQKNIKILEYIKNKILYLLVPIWLWNIVLSGAEIIVSGNFKSGETLMLKRILGNFIELRGSVFETSFWFISCLFLIQVLTFILVKWINKPILHYVIILGFVIFDYFQHIMFGKILPWHIDILGLGWMFYYVGFLIQQNNIFLKFQRNKQFSMLLIFGGVNIICTIINYYLTNSHTDMYLQRIDNIFLYLIMSYTGGAFICFLMFGIDQIYKKSNDLKVLNFIGQNTFVLYVLHKYCYKIFDLFCQNTFPGKGIIYSMIAIILIAPLCICINNFCPILAGKKRLS